jgi:hypothetical protein
LFTPTLAGEPRAIQRPVPHEMRIDLAPLVIAP